MHTYTNVQLFLLSSESNLSTFVFPQVFLLSSEQPEHLLAWLGGREEKWLVQLGLYIIISQKNIISQNECR